VGFKRVVDGFTRFKTKLKDHTVSKGVEVKCSEETQKVKQKAINLQEEW
jgi:hypothetical protein